MKKNSFKIKLKIREDLFEKFFNKINVKKANFYLNNFNLVIKRHVLNFECL